MIRRPPCTTCTDPPCPYTTLFRSERSSCRQAPIGLHGEGQDERQRGGGCGAGDADRLVNIVHRERREHVRSGGSQDCGLMAVIILRLGGAHDPAWIIAVPPGAHAYAPQSGRDERRKPASPITRKHVWTGKGVSRTCN